MAQVIDLSEIQSRIEARRDVCGQTSRENARRGLPREAVESLWQMMGSLYGHRWTSSYGDEVDPDRVWAATLYGLDESHIRSGLRECVDRRLEWPPTAPEFRGLCLGPDAGWERRRIESADAEWQRRALPPPRSEGHARGILNAIRETLGLGPKGGA